MNIKNAGNGLMKFAGAVIIIITLGLMGLFVIQSVFAENTEKDLEKIAYELSIEAETNAYKIVDKTQAATNQAIVNAKATTMAREAAQCVYAAKKLTRNEEVSGETKQICGFQ